MHKFWKINNGWCSAPHPNMTETVFDFINDREILSYSDNGKISMDECREICSGKHPWFFIFSDENEFIGLTALLRSDGENAEVCIMIKKEYRRKKIGSEVLNRICCIAHMSFGLKRLYARVLKDNQISVNFFRKNGFMKTEFFPENLKVNTKNESLYFFLELKEKDLLLSVIIPAHNSEKWIIECLESLSNLKCEIIIVDDASSDNTVKLTKNHIKNIEGAKLITSEKRLYAGGCRNLGIQYASGEYILFLDSDDYIFSQSMLKKMIKSAIFSNADIIKSTEAEFFSDKRSVRHFGKSYTGIITKKHRSMVFSDQIPIWMCLFRRQFISENNIHFAENVLSYEDNYFTFCTAACVGSVVTNPGILTSHRIRNDSLSHISDADIQKSFLEVAKLQFGFAVESGLIFSIPETMESCFFYSVFFSALYAEKVVRYNYNDIVFESVRFLKNCFPHLCQNLYRYNISDEEKAIFKTKWNQIP